MADDTRMPATIATIAEQLTTLARRMDERFVEVETKIGGVETNLRVLIEAVNDKVQIAYEAIVSLRDDTSANTRDHAKFEKRLENHSLRLLALESREHKTGE
jgi:hypothetical protein